MSPGVRVYHVFLVDEQITHSKTWILKADIADYIAARKHDPQPFQDEFEVGFNIA